MPRLNALVLPLTLAFVVILAGPAAPAPLRFDRGADLDWRVPAPHVMKFVSWGAPRALHRVRLVTVEVIILPSGRLATRRVADLPAPPDRGKPTGEDLIVLPLPAGMPLLLAALAGLAVAGRRGDARRLAGRRRAP
jgi:hypothetical protein